MKKLLIAAALLLLPASAQACDLSMELQDQLLHVVRQCAGLNEEHDFSVHDRYGCTTHITGIEQVDRVTYQVHYQDIQCEASKSGTLQFQLVGGDTLQIRDAENY